jgi:hypothetical protein
MKALFAFFLFLPAFAFAASGDITTPATLAQVQAAIASGTTTGNASLAQGALAATAVQSITTPGFFFQTPTPVVGGTANLVNSTNFRLNGFPYSSGTNSLAWGGFDSTIVQTGSTWGVTPASVGAATSAQGSLASTAVQPSVLLSASSAIVSQALTLGPGSGQALSATGTAINSTINQLDKWVLSGSTDMQFEGEPSVIYLPGSDSFQAWGSHRVGGNNLCFYAESTDGMHWVNSQQVIGGGTGGWSGQMSCQNVVLYGGTYYHYGTDLTGTSGGSGNILLNTSTDGKLFTLSGTAIAISVSGNLNGWDNSRLIKSGTTWSLFVESMPTGHVGWVSSRFTSGSPGGPWTRVNGGQPLWTTYNEGIESFASADSMTMGSVIQSGSWFYAWMWGSNTPDSLGRSVSEDYFTRSADLDHWVKPKRFIAISDAEYATGKRQYADVWVLEARGQCWLFTSTGIGGTGYIVLYKFNGPLSQLVSDRTDAVTINGEPVAATNGGNRQVLQYTSGSDARGFNWVDSYGSISLPSPICTAISSGTISPAECSGTLAWNPASPGFIISGHARLYLYSGSTWRISDSGNTDRFQGSGVSTLDPTGTYTPLAGATGTSSVVFYPVTTGSAVFTGTGAPNFISPIGTSYVNVSGSTGSAFYVNETGGLYGWTTYARSSQIASTVQQSVTALPSPTYSIASGAGRTFVFRDWSIPSQTNGLSNNNSYGGEFAEGSVFIQGSAIGQSIALTGSLGYHSTYGVQGLGGEIHDAGGVANCRFQCGHNSVNVIDGVVSSRIVTWCSGASSEKLRYKFGTNFSANAGDTIVMSPSGHTFIVDDTITDATVWTSSSVGGVTVRTITGGGAPTTSDTSLTVNGGGTVTTTYVSNTASNTGTHPECIIFPSTAGIQLYNKTFGVAGTYSLYLTQ